MDKSSWHGPFGAVRALWCARFTNVGGQRARDPLENVNNRLAIRQMKVVHKAKNKFRIEWMIGLSDCRKYLQ